MATIEIKVRIKHMTKHPNGEPKALLVVNDKLIERGWNQCWLPFYAVLDYCKEDDIITSIFIDDELAEEKGLI